MEFRIYEERRLTWLSFSLKTHNPLIFIKSLDDFHQKKSNSFKRIFELKFFDMARTDISNLADIQLLVNTFYSRIRENELLGPIFNERIGDRWPAHLEKMYRFWQTILLEVHTYTGSPFPPHAKLPVSQEHFDTWLKLWHGTVDEFFVGEKATDAKWRGDKMAEMFMIKIDYYRNNSAQPLS